MADEPRRVARENLCREAPFTEVRAVGDGSDGLTLDGYGLIFDSVTTVDSWEGMFQEVIARGSTKKSIREKTPKMQYDHGHHPLIGSIPIGRITEISEDERGLHVIARLTDNWLIQPVRDAIAESTGLGMSFRFTVIREEWHDQTGRKIPPEDVDMALFQPAALKYEIAGPLIRTLKEIQILEVGPVAWPQYETTSVGMRSIVIDLARLGEPETRKSLARAVYLADRAETTDAPLNHQTPADGHPPVEAAPPVTEVSPDEHPSAAIAKADRDALVKKYGARLADAKAAKLKMERKR